MKRILILTLLSCVGLCTHVMAGEEKKGDRDEEEERSISHDPVKVEIANDGVMIHFMASLGDVSIQMIDGTNDLVYREDVIVDSSLSYYIPMTRPYYRLFIIGDNINMDIPILEE